jgi:hypothetical protein
MLSSLPQYYILLSFTYFDTVACTSKVDSHAPHGRTIKDPDRNVVNEKNLAGLARLDLLQ